jgi:hypothetical protein
VNDIKDLLLDAVPPLPSPPDRLAAVRRRALARRRLRRVGAIVGGFVAVLALTGTMTVLAPADRPAGPIGGDPIPLPVHSSYSEPPRDFPMPGPGICPPTVQFMRLAPLDLDPGTTLPPISAITLCRYHQSSFDLSEGENSLRTGPVAGDVATFRDAFVNLLIPRASNWNPDGCREPSPGLPPFTVDVIFVHSPDGTTRAAPPMARYTCQNAWPQDPMIPLRAAVDAPLGPPY